MARRRLGPPQWTTEAGAGGAPVPAGLAEDPQVGPQTGLETKALFLPPHATPPIARIAGQSAAEAALQTLAAELETARAQGRIVEVLPLDAIDAQYLVRDRLAVNDQEMAALEASLRDRGQQVPIEVVDLGPDSAPESASGGRARYGLISGWRRLTALRRLARAEPGNFSTVLAIRRRPESSAEAYRAMVEENELRVGLSYYERARIVARAAGQEVFASPEAALTGLFGTASRARRSKIGSFVRIYESLDRQLRFPAAIPERLGLQLARALQDQEFVERLRSELQRAPAASAEAELALLARALRQSAAGQGAGQGAAGRSAASPPPPAAEPPAAEPAARPFAAKPAPALSDNFPLGPNQEHDAVLGPGLRLRWRAGRITLTGAQVDGALVGVLVDYLPHYLRDRQ